MARSTRNKKQPDSNRKANLPIKAEPLIEERAMDLLQDPDFFGKLRRVIERAGIVGEVRNAVALFIIAISSLLERPLSAILKGRSSTGKNKVASGVLRLLPESAIQEITSSSRTAWNYAGDDFKHRVVYLQERNDAAGAVHPVRLLISEGKLVRTVTVRKGPKLVTEKFEAEGPIASISTTTRDRIEIDDETRHVSLWVDDSPEQTRLIIERQLSPLPGLKKDEIEVWHEAYRLIQKRASVPIDRPNWLKKIGDKVFTDDPRVRRYFPAFLSAIDTIALIRSFQNHPEDYESDESIAIGFDDYAAATLIFGKIFAESLHRGDDECAATRKAVKEIASGQDGAGVDAEQLAEYLRISRDKAYARLRIALESKAVERANDPEKNNKKLYVPSQFPKFVPDPKEVATEFVRPEKAIVITHPITGKTLRFGGK